MDPSALFSALDNPVPTSSWTVSKDQPLAMVLMAKADLETVKTFYEFYPEALTKELFINVLKCGAKPGVVGFLATMRPDLVGDKAFVFAVNQGPGPNRPTDKEIVTMANINPEILLMPTGQDYVMSNCLCSVLTWKYSLELTQSLFKLIAGKTKEIVFPVDVFDDIDASPWVVVDENSRTKRAAFDKEALGGMEPLLDSNNLQNMRNACGKWELDAFLEFVRKVLCNQSICKLLLNFPEPSLDQEGQPNFFHSDSFKQALSKCKIEKLQIYVDQNDPLALGFLQCCLIQMPCLKDLSVIVDSDIAASKATPVLGHFMCSNSQLETLLIRATSDTTGKGLDPILSALENDQTLNCFYYRQGGFQPDRFKRYQDILAVVLQNSNDTLNHAKFSDGCTDEDFLGNLRSPLHPSQHLLPFYISLNRLGRKEASDPETTIAEFVDLLVEVKEDTIFFDADETHKDPATTEDISNILYGLLRENPANWSKQTSSSEPNTKSGSKRKHSALS
ncbi:expressed unknown protein [Seminavis robusta]|uniref:Uncharacterized protein n=1 Tax=Seminavis robusta TaxID=568900 RepID=A0A9N8EF12_9STRA|nr:expressed unknown protein [Seminavis robusta]|eukprot:Sro1090_g240161.1  (505) ;mRNA; r:19125-20639